MFVTLYLSFQLLDDLLASFESHLLGLVQPAAHVFDLSLQTFLHSLQVESVLLLQSQLLPHSRQLRQLTPFKKKTLFNTTEHLFYLYCIIS